jgi:CRP/FNR family cyclic AMP-dependent transcriptional regulator
MASDTGKLVDIQLLRRVPLLSVLRDDQLRELMKTVTRRTFPRNRTIVVEGDTTQSLYILLSGRCKVQMSDSEGKEVILAVLGIGDFFGEMGLLDDAPRSASVITVESSEFLTIAKEDFINFLNVNSEMAMLVIRGLVKRLRDADKKIESLALMDVYGRVARVLLEFSEETPDGRVVKTKLPRQDIAKMIGASREMVSRVMKGLETSGYLVPLDDGSLLLREHLTD